jgi:DNA replication protein DnaC
MPQDNVSRAKLSSYLLDTTLDNFDFTFNPKMNRSLVFDLATCAFIGKREDALFLGPCDPETFCTSLLHR